MSALGVGVDWLEISLAVEGEVAEAVAEVLARYAPQGVAIEAGPAGTTQGPVTVKAYLPADTDLSAKRRQVEEALWHLSQIFPVPEPTFHTIGETDWAEAWKEQLHPLRVGRRMVIKPSWREYMPRPEDLVIELDPGMAFGTGLHPTTQMCLAALEEFVRPGMAVLDLGTGSGILAIAAAKLGAGRVRAMDTDLTAVEVAWRNVVANGMAGVVQVQQGSLREVREAYDLVVVNILAKVIVEMVGKGLGTRLRLEGILVASGLVEDQEPEVSAALEDSGLALVGRQQEGEWVMLVARRGYLSSVRNSRLCR